MRYIQIIMILFVFTSCNKPVEEPIEETALYEQIWETRYHPERYVIHSNSHVFENVIIACQINSFEKKVDYNIAAYDKQDGEFLWAWNHPDASTVILDSYGYKNLIFARGRHSIFVFDIDTKKVLWEIERSDDMSNIGRPVFVDESLYLSTASKVSGTSLKKAEMRVYDVYAGEYEVLFTEVENEVKPYEPTIGTITLFTNELERNLAVFEVKYLATSVSPRITLPDLVCIDVDSREVLWRKTDYNELASGSNTIKYHNGKLYNTGDWSLYAFDPETGEELNRWQFWESHPLGSFNNADFTIVDDVVYTLDDLGHLNGINTETGHFEFSYQRGAANTQSPPVIHNDLILYSSFGHQSIEIFDTKQQRFVHKERDKSFGFQIVYDEEMELYFTTTDEIIHAFRIND